MKQVWIKIQSYVKPTLNVALFAGAVTGAFFGGYYYTSMKKVVNSTEIESVKVISATSCSIAVTERGELLVLNRIDGTYKLYDETIGLSVFKAYGNRITSNQPK